MQFSSYASRQTNKQTDRQTDSSQYFVPLPGGEVIMVETGDKKAEYLAGRVDSFDHASEGQDPGKKKTGNKVPQQRSHLFNTGT